MKVKVPREFGAPLVDQVRWTKHSEAGDLAPVMKFTSDETGLNRFPNANVVGDQQAHGWLPKRHEQRHELIRTRFDRDVGERPEGAGTGAKFELEGVAEQQCGRVISAERWIGLGKRGGFGEFWLQLGQEGSDILFGTDEWPEAKQ
jgi:hypothetical protein